MINEELKSLLAELSADPVRIVIIILVMLSVALFVLGVMTWMQRWQDRVAKRLSGFASGEKTKSHDYHTEGPFDVRWVEPVAKIILPKEGWRRSFLQSKLVQAGLRGKQSLNAFLCAKVLLAALLVSIALLLAPFFVIQVATVNPILSITFLILLGIIGFYLPNGILERRIRRRQLLITEGFPDAMDMLMVCVEAGMGLDAAMQKVGEEISYSHPSLGEEFTVLALELRAGKSRAEAFHAFADRTGVDVVRSFVALMLQAERYGTSVAVTLREYSDEMRTKRIQIAQEKAAKLPVKLIFPVLFFIFPAIFMVVFAPAVLQIYKELIVGGAFGGG